MASYGDDYSQNDCNRPRRSDPRSVAYLRSLPLDEGSAEHEIATYLEAQRHRHAGGTRANKNVDDNADEDRELFDKQFETMDGGSHQANVDLKTHMSEVWSLEVLRLLLSESAEASLRDPEAEAQAEHDAKTDIGWGHQIRSYVLQPYQLVKDLRTELETSNTQGVLDGDLDDFMAAALASRIETGQNEDAS